MVTIPSTFTTSVNFNTGLILFHLRSNSVTYFLNSILKVTTGHSGSLAGLEMTSASASCFQESFSLLPKILIEAIFLIETVDLDPNDTIFTSAEGIPMQNA